MRQERPPIAPQREAMRGSTAGGDFTSLFYDLVQPGDAYMNARRVSRARRAHSKPHDRAEREPKTHRAEREPKTLPGTEEPAHVVRERFRAG